MYGLKPLSEKIPAIADQAFARKFVMLGRILTHWQDIVGDDLANKTQPVKLHYRKTKDGSKRATASLDISTSSANATMLHYRKDLILERLNQIFGDRWITAIRFVPAEASEQDFKGRPEPRKTLTENDKLYLSEVLGAVEDPELKARLESLGQAMLQDRSRNSKQVI
ncbi:MAG: DUF721 domain-containing protein [Micavibrio aeruginosavorus]|uniref:DUF721 domain-containing protein n=1 Tax=Micavibrio aeruginosavorus TaxID=349221 RepID=A0A7T5R0U6_9BACT|nr:MAG: DUF721 domain-containing protein [Micavibrio aeruginosavorus]